ncbi:hypothetical protein PsAD2_04432 [Pseudovibrio axinellae]|uniref:DDE domain-containing protein n=1 Tax=Pseudovibrio axinellae TaxID=989403 RepID=A0A165T2D7_9HYPH|nr:hypothetical protein PsAD2_04432 [Pseudovibrio axinellae]SER31694.1 putative transposase [Pseudovibrio axinellae]
MFIDRLLSSQGVTPKRIITDKLSSYRAAKRKVMPAVQHRSHKRLNNRAENSHLPLRKRERGMQKFMSRGQLQRFLAVFAGLRNLFVPPRHQRSAIDIHLHRITLSHNGNRQLCFALEIRMVKALAAKFKLS